MPSCFTAPDGKKKNGQPKFKPDKNKYLYNIDTLWLNCNVANYDDVMDDYLRDELVSGREYFFDWNESKTIAVKLRDYDNELLFEIKGGQPPAYQYSIRNEDMAFYFAKSQRDNQLPIKIQINQFVLWSKGVERAYLEAIYILSSLGFGVIHCQLNRIDFAVHSDQFKWNLSDLKNFQYPGHYKPNFWRLDPITGDFETVYFGNRNRRQLRIYNKSKEIRMNKKYYFYELYKEREMDLENIWNIEIEVRRDFIKECKDFDGNNMFDDFDKVLHENRLSDLWSLLMQDYGLFYGSKHNAHWKQVMEGCPEKKFYNVEGFELVRIKDIDANFDREIGQIIGRLQTGVINKEDFSLDDAINLLKERYNEVYVKDKKRNFKNDVLKKKKKLMDNKINQTCTLHVKKRTHQEMCSQ